MVMGCGCIAVDVSVLGVAVTDLSVLGDSVTDVSVLGVAAVTDVSVLGVAVADISLMGVAVTDVPLLVEVLSNDLVLDFSFSFLFCVIPKDVSFDGSLGEVNSS